MTVKGRHGGRFGRAALCTVSSLALLAWSGTGPIGASFAQADGATQDNAAQVKDRRVRDEIFVTATRREQNLLDVPLSITAFTGEELVRNSQDDLADYIRLVPGLTLQQQSAGLNTVTIRGVSGGGGQRAKAPISFYIDDVPVVSDPVATPDIKTFDIERVEVLRGPQGTLFGESALGGVIRIISKKPNTQEFEANVRASYLTFARGDGGYTFDGVVNLPIVEDKFAIRASVSRRDEGGWIDNLAPNGTDDQNDLDYWNARVTALWDINENLDVSAMAYFVRSDYGSRQAADENFDQFINVDETRVDDIDQFNFTLKHDFGWADLTSSSSYFKRETSRLFDLTFFNAFLPGGLAVEGAVPPGFLFDQFFQTLNVDDKSFTQEIRLVSPSEGRFRWVAGLYYFDTDNDVGVDFLGNPSIDFNVLRLRRKETYKQYAAFGEAEFDILDNLTFVAGGRYTKEDRQIDYDQSDDFTIIPRFLPAIGMFQVDIDYGIFTPKFALQYRPTDNAQIYASATRGFRGPGGNTDFNDDGIRLNVYDAEKIWSYELGAKGVFLDGDIVLEGAVFYTDWSDRQEVVNPEAPFNEQFVSNIGSAEIYGAEITSSFALGDYITIGGQGSYISTEITESARDAFEGLPLIGQPEWRGSVSADVDYPLGNGFNIIGHFDASYQGDVIFSFNTPVEQGAYKLLNASAGIQGDNWGIDFFVKNMTDEFIKFGAGINTSVGEPRSFGVAVNLEF